MTSCVGRPSEGSAAVVQEQENARPQRTEPSDGRSVMVTLGACSQCRAFGRLLGTWLHHSLTL